MVLHVGDNVYGDIYLPNGSFNGYVLVSCCNDPRPRRSISALCSMGAIVTMLLLQTESLPSCCLNMIIILNLTVTS
jgi:hypothetical protein